MQGTLAGLVGIAALVLSPLGCGSASSPSATHPSAPAAAEPLEPAKERSTQRNKLTAKDIERQLHIFRDHYSAARCTGEGGRWFTCLVTYRDEWVDPTRVEVHIESGGERYAFLAGRCRAANPEDSPGFACQHLVFNLNKVMSGPPDPPEIANR